MNCPSHVNLFAAFEATAQRYSELTAVVAGRQKITYGALAQRSVALSIELQRSGVQAGERIAVIVPNSAEFIIACLAIWRAGAVVIPFHVKYQLDELANYVLDCEVTTVLGRTRMESIVEELRSRDIGVRRWLLYSGEEDRWHVPCRDSVFAESEPGFLSVGPESTALIQYSTGSTGKSKRVRRSHRQLVDECTTVSALFGITHGDRILGAVPFYHSFGFMHAMTVGLLSGATIYALGGDFLPRDLARVIENEKITGFPGVPFMYHMLVEIKAKIDLSSLRYAISAGAPLSQSVATSMLKNHAVGIHQLYGTTETGVIAVNLGRAYEHALATAGRPIPGVTVTIYDDSGEKVPVGVPGNIAVSSAYAAQSYDEDIGKSDSYFENGLFYPGDQGKWDTEGRIELVGRKRRFINVAGNKVDPTEVENLLRKYPAIEDVAVVGVPDTAGLERVKAVLVASCPIKESDIFDFCRTRVADFKCPRIIEFRAEIPRNPMGKVLRKYLIEAAGS